MPTYEATESDFELIPEGTIVHAKVVEIGDVETITPQSGKAFDKIPFKFEITQGEWQGWTIRDGCAPKFSINPPSKLYEWACAILGRTFEVGEKFNSDDLLNLPCRIEIGHKPGRDDTVWMRVETLMPITGAGSAEDVFGS